MKEKHSICELTRKLPLDPTVKKDVKSSVDHNLQVLA